MPAKPKIPEGSEAKVARMIMKHGKQYVADFYGLAKVSISFYCQKKLSRFVPPGNWRQFKGTYYVFDDGKIWCRKSFKYLVPTKHKKSKYRQVWIHGKVYRVHTLVLTLFKGKRRPDQQARHLNGNKDDNRLKNLKWGTAFENYEDRVRHNTDCRGSRHGATSMTEVDVLILRAFVRKGDKDIMNRYAKKFGKRRSSFYAPLRGTTWKHVEAARK